MAVAWYLQCESSPGVSRGFAILGSRLEQFKFLKTTHIPSINRAVTPLRFFDGRLCQTLDGPETTPR